MKLTIDIGNTLTKAAVFKGNELKEGFSFSGLAGFDLNKILKNYPAVKSAIVSSVINNDDGLINNLKEKVSLIVIDHQTKLPVKNNYKTPETLGKDRISNAVGANFLFPGENVLIIDAGTCIKYDFVSKNNSYEGGSISPGLQMRYKALNIFTSKLPLLEISEKEILTGRNTEESITSGVQTGIIAEAEGIIEKYLEKHPDLKIVITGGDMQFFKARLSKKNSIFADPFLLMKGLNTILDLNAKN